MASFSTLTTITTINALSSVSLHPLQSKSYVSRSNHTCRVAPKTSCNASKKDDQHQTSNNTKNIENKIFDRRNILIGLGRLYGAAATLIGGAVLSKPATPDVDPKKPKSENKTSEKTPHQKKGPHGHHDEHGIFGIFSKAKHAKAAEAASVTFPKPLNDVILTNVERPVKSRSKKEKENEEEVLIIELESRKDVYSKFDVYVNDEDERPTKENRTQTEYAGSFVNVPRKQNIRRGGGGGGGGADSNVMMTTSVKFGLSELIDDLGADDDQGIDVSIVPRTGTESVVIKNVRIELLS